MPSTNNASPQIATGMPVMEDGIPIRTPVPSSGRDASSPLPPGVGQTIMSGTGGMGMQGQVIQEGPDSSGVSSSGDQADTAGAAGGSGSQSRLNLAGGDFGDNTDGPGPSARGSHPATVEVIGSGQCRLCSELATMVCAQCQATLCVNHKRAYQVKTREGLRTITLCVNCHDKRIHERKLGTRIKGALGRCCQCVGGGGEKKETTTGGEQNQNGDEGPVDVTVEENRV